MNIFLVKNLYDYEKVISPPNNLPDNFISYYITDNEKNSNNCKKFKGGIMLVLQISF